MEQITYENLTGRLLGIVESAAASDYESWRLFRVLYETGCRYSDVETINDWRIEEANNSLLILMPKTSYWRYCPLNTLSEKFKEEFTQDQYRNIAIRYDTSRRRFAAAQYPHSLFLNHKRLDLHAFRHRYAMYLRDIGYTYEELAPAMGLTSVQVAIGYAETPIYTT